jgi:hypothetical protein
MGVDGMTKVSSIAPQRPSGGKSITREEAIRGILLGYTPRYVEKCKAMARRTGSQLNHLLDRNDATWVQMLAVRWGLTEQSSHE